MVLFFLHLKTKNKNQTSAYRSALHYTSVEWVTIMGDVINLNSMMIRHFVQKAILGGDGTIY